MMCIGGSFVVIQEELLEPPVVLSQAKVGGAADTTV
jgi:hypothetical protein